MSLEKVNVILAEADKKGYGVVGMNCFNYESIACAIETAEEENVPILVMLYPGMSKYMRADAFAAVTKELAAKAKIPVGLHLDHCTSFELIMSMIKDGFTSVMIDASSLDFEENVRATAEVVRAAHAMGVDVEAELGHVGSASKADDFLDKSGYTQPDMAVEFVRRTGVDTLAVAIGSAHGQYVTTPKLDLELLDRINRSIDIPLVLHGGTGIPDDQLKEAVKLGINKMNVGTGYFQTFYGRIKEYVNAKNEKENIFDTIVFQKEGAKEFVRGRIRALKP